ncbi:MAG: ABC transporter substrate-binding protein [Deltaproteobacteria bacterium]|nr:ABC transporter substrate-binding protein [Deltaproteobacteria bacterium]
MAQKKRTSVKLGLMPPLTGLVELYGSEILRAGEIACQEINDQGGVLGRPLELVVKDDGSLPETAVPAAEKLVSQGCSAIIGNLLSNSRIAVAYRVAEPRKIPYLNFSFYEGGIINRYFFHFAALPNQQIDHMIPAMKQKYGPKMFFAGNNYEWPRGSIDAAKQALTALGGEVAGEEYLPIGVKPDEIEKLLHQVALSGADVFVPYFAGLDQVNLLTGFTQKGLKSKMAVVMGHYDEAMASRLSPDVREGFYSSNTYFMTIPTEENRQYLQRLASMPGITGIWPHGNGILTNFGEGTYLCVKAFALAANQAGSLDRENLVDALETLSFSGPQGPIRMDPDTHHARVNSYLSRCERDGSFSIVENFGSNEPVIPERYRHMGTHAKATQDQEIRIAARILDYMTEGVTLIRVEDGTVIYANPGAEIIFGFDRGKLVGKKMTGLYDSANQPGEDVEKGINSILYKRGVWVGDVKYLHQKGHPIWCSVSISAFTHAEYGEVWMAVQKDITDQKQTEEELRVSQGHLSTVVTSAPLGLMALDAQGYITLCTGKSFTDMDLEGRDCIGKDLRQLFPANPEITDGFHTCLLGESAVLQIPWKKRDYEIRFSPMMSNQRVVEGATLLWMDITEQKKADRLKKEFVSTVSHELRTPLTSIRGVLGLIEGDQVGEISPKVKQLIEIAMRNTLRLSLLINDLLDMEKIEVGGMVFNFLPVDLVGVILQSVEQTNPYAQNLGVTLEVATKNQPIMVKADESRLLQVMANLISNAIKFSPAGGKVRIQAETGPDSARVRVIDSGKGISENFKPMVFQKFAQQDGADTKEKGGTGLGLAITKSILEHHQAVIDFVSDPEKGTEFFFDIPLAPQIASSPLKTR